MPPPDVSTVLLPEMVELLTVSVPAVLDPAAASC